MEYIPTYWDVFFLFISSWRNTIWKPHQMARREKKALPSCPGGGVCRVVTGVFGREQWAVTQSSECRLCKERERVFVWRYTVRRHYTSVPAAVLNEERENKLKSFTIVKKMWIWTSSGQNGIVKIPIHLMRKTLMVLLGLQGGWGCGIYWHILSVGLVKPEILL